MNKTIFKHFGLEGRGFWRDQDFNQLVKDIAAEVAERKLVAISGAWGQGKSTLFKQVRKAMQVPGKEPLIVRVASEEKENLRIGTIMSAVVMDISQESPRRDTEARTRQVVRLIGERAVTEKRTVMVYIDNAHRLHVNTIRAIKDFMENEFAGVSPLFSVVLVGQEPLKTKINRYGEVRCRTSSYELNEANGWMTFQKRVQFIGAVYGDALDQGARNRLAAICRSPLAIIYNVEKQLERAYAGGIDKLTADFFEMDLKEHYSALEAATGAIGYDELAKAAGTSPATVSRVMTGTDVKNKDAIKAALAKIEQGRIRSQQAGMRKAVNE